MPTNVGGLTVFGAIEVKWLALGGVNGFLGAPLSNESPTFDGAGRAQTFKGGIISWHPATGPNEVHGAILARWLEVGRERFGHPITDETPCPDNVGRFNHFRSVEMAGSPESSIYWSPASGPHDVFGAIRDKWASMGFERSVLRYPMGSEHDQAGARVQRFQGGVMTWTPSDGASYHEVFNNNQVKFDSGQVNSDLALNGNVQLAINRDGTFTFNTHAHDSGATNIDYGMAAVLVTSRGPFQFSSKGHVSGLLGNRNDDISIPGQNPALAAAFDDIVAGGRLLPPTLSGSDKLLGAIEDLVGEAAKQLAEAGIKALVTVVVG